MKIFKNFEKYVRKCPNNFVQDCRHSGGEGGGEGQSDSDSDGKVLQHFPNSDTHYFLRKIKEHTLQASQGISLYESSVQVRCRSVFRPVHDVLTRGPL